MVGLLFVVFLYVLFFFVCFLPLCVRVLISVWWMEVWEGWRAKRWKTVFHKGKTAQNSEQGPYSFKRMEISSTL